METVSTRASRRNWARLIQRVYEVDSLICPNWGHKMRVMAVITEPHEVWKILECLKRNHALPFEKVVTKVSWFFLIFISVHINENRNAQGRGMNFYIFRNTLETSHFSIFLTECPVLGSMSMRRRTFFVSKNIRRYFMGKWRGFTS